MILYPDDYTSQTSATSYTCTEWAAMEQAGCVFLPAAGFRDGSNAGTGGTYGSYWSSTSSSSSSAYCMLFNSSSVDPADMFIYRNRGFSVRLITECQ